jgi:uncharacterized alkaline shock family protein YloU
MTDRTLRESAHGVALRVITLLVGLIFIAVAVPFFGQPLGLIIPLTLDQPGIQGTLDLAHLPFRQAATYVGLGIASGMFGGVLLVTGLMPAARTKKMMLLRPASDRRFGGGTVRISEASVRNMIAGAAESVAGVREAVPVVRLKNDGWRVKCRISVTPEVALADASGKVREAISEVVLAHTGLPASSVDVETHQSTLHAAKQLN